MTRAVPPRHGPHVARWPAAPAAGHPATDALVDAGLLTPGQAAAAHVSDLSRAHGVWSVTAAGAPPVVVKSGAGHGGPDLAVECLVYRMTAWCTPLARALPTPLHVDEDQQVVVLADVSAAPGAGSLAVLAGPPPALAAHATDLASAPLALPHGTTPVAVAGALGRTLGALHRATAGLPLPPARTPMVLTALADPTSTARLGSAVHEAVLALAADTRFTDAAREIGRPAGSCLVHHDLKWDNVVLDAVPPGATAADATPVVTLVDWELAGRGDPAWDLGCLLAEHLCRADDPTRLDAGARALLRGYASTAAPDDELLPTIARRTTLSAVLRLVQMGLEVAYSAHVPAHPVVDAFLGRATSATTATAELSEEVSAWLR